MSKFISFLTALVLMVAMTPFSLAYEGISADKPLKIKSAVLETNRQRVIGKVTVCNSDRERVKFHLDAVNETINSLYGRRLSIAGATCQTYKLNFTKHFAEMSNAGDEVRFLAKSIAGLTSFGKHTLSDPYVTKVVEGNKDEKNCGDAKGDDNIYSVCTGDFIYHKPSGLRIKVITFDDVRTDLLITHVRWGGVKDVRIYKNRSKKVVSGDNKNTKVEISNLLGDNNYDFLLKLESSK